MKTITILAISALLWSAAVIVTVWYAAGEGAFADCSTQAQVEACE